MSETPTDPAAPAALLDRAEAAQRGGRFALTRKLLAELGSLPLAPAEQQRAAALRDRLRPDRMVAVLIATCLLLFIAIISATWR